MKRNLFLFLTFFLVFYSNAQSSQDYSLEGLSKVCLNYYEVSSFHDGRAIVKNVKLGEDGYEKVYGVIDKEGNEIVPCSYNFISSYHEGMAQVKKKGKFGFINTKGKEIIPCMYDETNLFSEGVAAVKRGNKWGYVDSLGKEVLPCVYSTAYDFSEGLACVYKPNGPNGYINKQGKMVLQQTGGVFSEGLAVKDDTKFIDKTGKIVFKVETEVHQCGEFSEGLAFVQKDWCYGYIDKSGHLVIPITYSEAKNFSEGLASVKKGQCGELDIEGKGRYGYIDKKGEVVVPFIYKWGSSFNEGVAAVKKADSEKSEYIFIDKIGKQIFPLVFDEACGFSEGLAAVKRGDKWGYVDKNGKCSLDF